MVEVTATAEDLNAVRIRGRVSTTPERRVLPSGDEVVAFRVVVRRDEGGVDALDVSLGPAPPRGSRRTAGQVGRRVLASAERLDVDDRIEVVGQLRRRWWDAGGTRRSRLEVRGTAVARIVEDGPTPLAAAGLDGRPTERS